MAMEIKVLNNQIKQVAWKPTSTFQVPFLIRSNNHVRQGQIVLPESQNYAADLLLLIDTLWSQSQAVPDGLRAWFAFKQRDSDEFLNKLIFTVFVQVSAGADLATMLGAANMVLNDDPTQKQIYQSLNQALQGATEIQMRQFVALALMVAFGKLGQR